MNCNTCNANDWKADIEIDEDVEYLYLICHACGNIWTAQVET